MPRDARFGNAALCAALEAMKLDFQGRWTRTPCLGLNFQQPFSLSPRYCATATIGRNASSGSRSDAKPFPRAIQKRERRSRDIRCHRAKCRADYSAPGTTRSRGLGLLAKYPLSRLQRFIDQARAEDGDDCDDNDGRRDENLVPTGFGAAPLPTKIRFAAAKFGLRISGQLQKARTRPCRPALTY